MTFSYIIIISNWHKTLSSHHQRTISLTKINPLMVYRNVVTFSSETETKLCRQNAEVTKKAEAGGTNNYQYVTYSSYCVDLIFN
jgi:hypothetical protein